MYSKDYKNIKWHIYYLFLRQHLNRELNASQTQLSSEVCSTYLCTKWRNNGRSMKDKFNIKVQPRCLFRTYSTTQAWRRNRSLHGARQEILWLKGIIESYVSWFYLSLGSLSQGSKSKNYNYFCYNFPWEMRYYVFLVSNYMPITFLENLTPKGVEV